MTYRCAIFFIRFIYGRIELCKVSCYDQVI